MGEVFFVLLLGGAGFALFTWWVVKALRSGVVHGAAGAVEKARRPILFRVMIAIYGFVAILCVIIALEMLLL